MPSVRRSRRDKWFQKGSNFILEEAEHAAKRERTSSATFLEQGLPALPICRGNRI